MPQCGKLPSQRLRSTATSPTWRGLAFHLSHDAAVVMFTPLAITQVVATMLTDPAVERVPPHRLVALPMASMAGACLLMGTMGPSGERSPVPWCWGSRSQAFGPSTRGLHSLLRMQVCGRDTRVTFVITILGAALGPLPCCWSSSPGGYFVVLVAGAILCARAATANLVAKPPRPKPLARSYRHRD
jgi:hypothetical protein